MWGMMFLKVTDWLGVMKMSEFCMTIPKMYFLVSMKNMRLCLYILATYSMHGVTRCFEEKIASFCWKITKFVAGITSSFIKLPNVYIKFYYLKYWCFLKKKFAKHLHKLSKLQQISKSGQPALLTHFHSLCRSSSRAESFELEWEQ